MFEQKESDPVRLVSVRFCFVPSPISYLLVAFCRSLQVRSTVTCKLSLRISKSVPVRRTRNCETRIRSWRTTEPDPAICTLLCVRALFIFVSQIKVYRQRPYLIKNLTMSINHIPFRYGFNNSNCFIVV